MRFLCVIIICALVTSMRAAVRRIVGIDGFSSHDMHPITRDGLDEPVKWKRDPKERAGRPVQLSFELKVARLFAFDLR